MAAVQQGFRRRISVVFLAALLLVPVALSGHTHSGQPLHPCSVCALTHHAPIVVTPVVTLFSTPFTAHVATLPCLLAGGRLAQAPRTGRAPPSPSFIILT